MPSLTSLKKIFWRYREKKQATITLSRESLGLRPSSDAIFFRSIDATPMDHPFITPRNAERFRVYSKQVRQFAREYHEHHPTPLSCGFAVNMNQNMYMFAKMAKRRGWSAELYLNTMDTTAIARPEWEEFDGEYPDVTDGAGFLADHPEIEVEVPVHSPSLEPCDANNALLEAYEQFKRGDTRAYAKILGKYPTLRMEAFFENQGYFNTFSWAKSLTKHDVVFATSTPFAAYASGIPYSLHPVGGDMMLDCGRRDNVGRAILTAFAAARFIIGSGLSPVAHARRLGLNNPVFLPYPMDSQKYRPGPGMARKEWESICGPGVYALMTARIDTQYKGQDSSYFDALTQIAKKNPQLRLVFLAWGENKHNLEQLLSSKEIAERCLILPPVGKKRLVDYLRSCDVVLDQMKLGYYGLTALEAAAVGRPVIMNVRQDLYEALYDGDPFPALSVQTAHEMANALDRLVNDSAQRNTAGNRLQEWIQRHHKEEPIMKDMLSLLRLTADKAPLPKDIQNPMDDPLCAEEEAYHTSCIVPINKKQ